MRAVMLVVATLTATLAVPAAAAGPADAHATVVGTDPADGAVVEVPPTEYVIHLDAKPGTVHGDPVRIYSPTGTRVDAGQVRILDGGDALAVDLSAEALLPEGEYQVVYRVVSEDTHLIAGRFSFRSRGPADTSLDARLRPPPPHPLADTCTSACRNWPQAAAATGALLMLAVAGTRRWRRARQERLRSP